MIDIFLAAAVAMSVAVSGPVDVQDKRIVEPQRTFETRENYEARVWFETEQARLIPAGRPLGPSQQLAAQRSR